MVAGAAANPKCQRPQLARRLPCIAADPPSPPSSSPRSTSRPSRPARPPRVTRHERARCHRVAGTVAGLVLLLAVYRLVGGGFTRFSLIRATGPVRSVTGPAVATLLVVVSFCQTVIGVLQQLPSPTLVPARAAAGLMMVVFRLPRPAAKAQPVPPGPGRRARRDSLPRRRGWPRRDPHRPHHGHARRMGLRARARLRQAEDPPPERRLTAAGRAALPKRAARGD